ncbi:MAG: glycosyltransferase [Acidobacteria bacterium]|nr:MAG: glycosyltransferase [Acidobacteriota bacterium]
MIRVARIITRLNIGGPSIQAINLSRELTADGFETCLIHGHLADGEGDMTQLLSLGPTQTVYIDELVRPVSPLRDLRALWSIYRALLRWKPDIVHTHLAKAGTLGRLASIAYNWTPGRRRRARLVHTYHGHVFEGYFNAVSTRVFLVIERWLAKRTDVLITISPLVVNDVLHTYRIGDARRVRIIPLGLNLDGLLALSPSDRLAARRTLAIADGVIVVATVGRLTAIKQQILFLQMAQRLVRQSHRFVFLVVGDGELRADLEMQAKELGVEEHTRFLGWRRDLETIYAATDVFVLTSRNEGTPVALIEAMAAGVASVSTDVGGVRDVIAGPRLGSVVPFGAPEALAAAVAELADDPVRRQHLGLQARASVRDRFQGGRLVGDIRQLYGQLLSAENSVQ